MTFDFTRAVRMHGACWAIAMCVVGALGCDRLPGKPKPRETAAALDTPAGFAGFYAEKCAGCHGVDGTHGPARPMRDAAYLAAVPAEAMLSILRDGIAGTRMPGFGGNRVGATDDAALAQFIKGMNNAWASSAHGAPTIKWSQPVGTGDLAHGRQLFDERCLGCHARTIAAGATLAPGSGGSVTDVFYLRLVSDQHLRTSILFGRADTGMPGAAGPFRAADGTVVAGTLSETDIADLVSYLAELRGGKLLNSSSTTQEAKGGAR